jgi:hypothetical protein
LHSRTTSFVCSTAFLALVSIFGSASQARAGYLAANNLSPDNDLSVFEKTDRSDSAAGSAEPVRDIPSPHQNRNPIAGRDFLSSLFGLTLGRSASNGAGSTSNSHDSGGSGQPFVLPHSHLMNLSPAIGDTVGGSDSSPSDPIASLLFRPPRLS